MSIRDVLGARIRELRDLRGMSQGELGRWCGAEQKAISAYERGRTFPQPETIERLATALGVEVFALFQPEGTPATVRQFPPTVADVAFFVERVSLVDPAFPARALRVLRSLTDE